MKIKYFGHRTVSIICNSKNRYIFEPLSEVEIINFKDLYELIRHPVHGSMFRIEGDPDYKGLTKVHKKPGIVTLSSIQSDKSIKVKIKTVSNTGEDEVEKTIDDVVDDIEEMVKENEDSETVSNTGEDKVEETIDDVVDDIEKMVKENEDSKDVKDEEIKKVEKSTKKGKGKKKK